MFSHEVNLSVCRNVIERSIYCSCSGAFVHITWSSSADWMPRHRIVHVQSSIFLTCLKHNHIQDKQSSITSNEDTEVDFIIWQEHAVTYNHTAASYTLLLPVTCHCGLCQFISPPATPSAPILYHHTCQHCAFCVPHISIKCDSVGLNPALLLGDIGEQSLLCEIKPYKYFCNILAHNFWPKCLREGYKVSYSNCLW